MTELERLTERIRSAMCWGWTEPSEIAERLIDDGDVIVPPCKVGDTVYVLDIYPDGCKCADCEYYYPGGMGDHPECEKSEDGRRYHGCVEIREEKALRTSVLVWLQLNDFGETVFLTREEAEAALAERRRTQ